MIEIDDYVKSVTVGEERTVSPVNDTKEATMEFQSLVAALHACAIEGRIEIVREHPCSACGDGWFDEITFRRLQ